MSLTEFAGLAVVYAASLLFILTLAYREFRRVRFNFNVFFTLLYLLTFYFGFPLTCALVFGFDVEVVPPAYLLQALLSATPRLNPDQRRERIKLTGELPSPLNPPPGCPFNARCRRAFHVCPQQQPQLKQYGDQLVACFAVDEDEKARAEQLPA